MFRLHKLIIIITLAAGGCLCFGGVAYAGEGVAISVDGQERDYGEYCRIVDGRTMAPLRFLAEDEFFAAEVDWDGEMRQVTVTAREHSFVYTIDSPQVLVDGAPQSMEAAAYIEHDRTYVPLRFFAESLGADVEWDARRRLVSITMDAAERVYAYYYYQGLSEIQTYAHLYTDIAFRWFETDGEGNLFFEYDQDNAAVLSAVKDLGLDCHASVVLMGKEENHSLLSVPERRKKLINALVTTVKRDGYDGVNIDFELMAAADGVYLNLFLQQLRDALPEEKELSVAVYGRTARDSWASPYDYAALGEACDAVVIMAYDYSYAGSSAGPIAPLWWVEDVLQYSLAQMPAEKILLGLPTYGYDWPQGGKGTSVTFSKWERLWDTYRLSGGFDEASQELHYTYWDNNGVKHDVWLEDEQSYAAKLRLCEEYDIAGVSWWRIGTGFTNIYTALEAR
ncbi:MAG: glycosyl hydrolase family 18 protein [Syntrophomonadaceae bacterium]|nr:glycosyl hydrolase family 18 protein [Syntrophomonadaceae bacterium]